MKQLDFPNSAAAVRQHGREFHEQDFFEAVPASAAHPPFGTAGGSPARVVNDYPKHARSEHRTLVGERLRKLARWTLTCAALALAAAVIVSWLVRPDLQQVKWIDSAAPRSMPVAR